MLINQWSSCQSCADALSLMFENYDGIWPLLMVFHEAAVGLVNLSKFSAISIPGVNAVAASSMSVIACTCHDDRDGRLDSGFNEIFSMLHASKIVVRMIRFGVLEVGLLSFNETALRF